MKFLAIGLLNLTTGLMLQNRGNTPIPNWALAIIYFALAIWKL